MDYFFIFSSAIFLLLDNKKRYVKDLITYKRNKSNIIILIKQVFYKIYVE